MVAGPAVALAVRGSRFRMGVRRGFGVVKELPSDNRMWAVHLLRLSLA